MLGLGHSTLEEGERRPSHTHLTNPTLTTELEQSSGLGEALTDVDREDFRSDTCAEKTSQERNTSDCNPPLILSDCPHELSLNAMRPAPHQTSLSSTSTGATSYSPPSLALSHSEYSLRVRTQKTEGVQPGTSFSGPSSPSRETPPSTNPETTTQLWDYVMSANTRSQGGQQVSEGLSNSVGKPNITDGYLQHHNLYFDYLPQHEEAPVTLRYTLSRERAQRVLQVARTLWQFGDRLGDSHFHIHALVFPTRNSTNTYLRLGGNLMYPDTNSTFVSNTLPETSTSKSKRATGSEGPPSVTFPRQIRKTFGPSNQSTKSSNAKSNASVRASAIQSPVHNTILTGSKSISGGLSMIGTWDAAYYVLYDNFEPEQRLAIHSNLPTIAHVFATAPYLTILYADHPYISNGAPSDHETTSVQSRLLFLSASALYDRYVLLKKAEGMKRARKDVEALQAGIVSTSISKRTAPLTEETRAWAEEQQELGQGLMGQRETTDEDYCGSEVLQHFGIYVQRAYFFTWFVFKPILNTEGGWEGCIGSQVGSGDVRKEEHLHALVTWVDGVQETFLPVHMKCLKADIDSVSY